MKVLSVKQPSAYLICSGIKDIENRTWKCPQKYIGQRVLIHASATSDNRVVFSEYQYKEIVAHGFEPYGDITKLAHENRSAIIGSVEIVGCVINHPSIWAEKTEIPFLGDVLEDLKYLKRVVEPNPIIYNWVLVNPILFDNPILNVKGKLSFWDYELEEGVRYEQI